MIKVSVSKIASLKRYTFMVEISYIKDGVCINTYESTNILTGYYYNSVYDMNESYEVTMLAEAIKNNQLYCDNVLYINEINIKHKKSNIQKISEDAIRR